ncbi:hypothetical protein MtrunA17_Chr7g0264251 [Medicago truncatula]|uniref:Uncharacterized protein n=1 Tax=Medicago truncatula TaxID=3880 RepID=A0A396H5C1_MEDTR|nr:hypothetical protein MtrunA17_Chr7g0264251 [Medicago truncatula]
MYFVKCDQGGTFSKGELKGFQIQVSTRRSLLEYNPLRLKCAVQHL